MKSNRFTYLGGLLSNKCTSEGDMRNRLKEAHITFREHAEVIIIIIVILDGIYKYSNATLYVLLLIVCGNIRNM